MLKMQSSARRKAYITAMKLLMGVAAVLTCALVVGMIGYNRAAARRGRGHLLK